MPMDKRRDNRKKKSSSKGELSVIPLGGLGEIGKNLTVFRYDNDIIIVDCGLKFPEEDMLGIDFVIPDVQYLIENKDKILGIFITHGHEDHIGALPFILPRLDVPLYCSRLAAGMIANKMEDARTSYKPKYREVCPGDIIEAGAFSVEFIPVCHSIPDALALSIHTPMGMIVHTGDFKLDPTPIDGVGTDYSSFAALGKEGVMLMLSDSTNIEKDGITPSEKTVGQTFERLFRIHKDRRIVIATFSSNLHRSQQVINAAGRFNRKVVLAGRSMIKNVELAIDLGYINVPEGMIVTSQEADQMPGNRVVILTTGSQGEPFSGLVMMSRGTHRMVKLGPNMLSMIKPRYFVPVHGEYRHLVRHAQLAREMGVASKNVFVMQNGDVLKFKGKSNASVESRVQAGAVLVDGIALGEFEGGLLRERRELSENGIVAISITLDSKSRLTAPIQIQTKGSVFSTEDGSTFSELENAEKMGLDQYALTPGAKPETLPTEIRKRIRDVFGKVSRNYPVIVPLITFVE